MSTPSGYSVGRFFDQVRNSTLKSVLTQARALSRLEQQVIRHLPTPLAGHVRVAGIEGNRLILLVDSQEWVLQARMSAALLRTTLSRDGLPKISDVVVRVSPGLARAGLGTSPRRRARPISEASAEVLAAAARDADDPRLADAFMRLAAKVRGSD